jgi:hypothetical protein
VGDALGVEAPAACVPVAVAVGDAVADDVGDAVADDVGAAVADDVEVVVGLARVAVGVQVGVAEGPAPCRITGRYWAVAPASRTGCARVSRVGLKTARPASHSAATSHSHR